MWLRKELIQHAKQIAQENSAKYIELHEFWLDFQPVDLAHD